MKVAIVDTETTGVGPQDEPVAVGLILVEVDDKGAVTREVDRYHGLREPTVPIHWAAAKVHGMKIADLRGKHFDLERVSSILSAADVAVAHNASFDARMIAKVIDTSPAWRCSLRQFPWVVESGKKLDHVCATLGIERPVPHNALTDCEALLACLQRRTGKTDRSRTYLALLLAREAFSWREAKARPTRKEYRQQAPPRGPTAGLLMVVATALGKLVGRLLRR